MKNKVFSEKYYAIYSGTFSPLREFFRKRLGITPRVSQLFREIRELAPASKILDVGCGIGGLLELFETERNDIETFGIDIGEPAEFRAKGRFLRGSTLKLPFPNNSFEIVTCAHVIEHLTNPEDAIQEIERVCRPGGSIYIEAPSPRSALMPFGFNFWDDPTHVRPHTPISLRKLLATVGCTQIITGTKTSIPAIVFGLPYMLIGSFMKDPQARTIFPAYAFGHTVWALAKKNAD